MGNEQQGAARRDLSALMRQMRGWPPERAAQAVWEWMGAHGFEQPQGTPTDDEREALDWRLEQALSVVGFMAPWRVAPEQIEALHKHLTVARRYVGRTVQGEPALIECPHWSPGRITMRKGCTACAAGAGPST